MYLMIFDVIDSKRSKIQIGDVIRDVVIKQYIEKFKLDSNLIEIAGGDQLRIMSNNSHIVMELIMYTYMLLASGGLKARCFITVGSVEVRNKTINAMSGELFYKNKELEVKVKARKPKGLNSVYYDGLENTLELSLLFETYSKLILIKPDYLAAVYGYEYQGLTQSEIAKERGLSQSTVNNQLNKSNSNLISSYNIVITKLIEEELCKVEI